MPFYRFGFCPRCGAPGLRWSDQRHKDKITCQNGDHYLLSEAERVDVMPEGMKLCNNCFGDGETCEVNPPFSYEPPKCGTCSACGGQGVVPK